MSGMLYPCMLCVALLLSSKECVVPVIPMSIYGVFFWYDVCENSVGSVYVGGYGGLSESGLCVFRKLCPVCLLVVGNGPSVLL